MSFDQKITQTIPAMSTALLKRRSSTDVKVSNMLLRYSREGIRVTAIHVGNMLLGGGINEGTSIEHIQIDYPINVPAHVDFALELTNPTREPVRICWEIEVQKILFAVALERVNSQGQWVEADIIYCHALTGDQAITCVLAGEKDKKKVRVVGGAKVIGYHVEDKEGKLLSV